MAISLQHATELQATPASVILKALGDHAFLSNPANLDDVKTLNGAAEEMDRLMAERDVGLTIAFKEVRVNTSSEGLRGKLFKEKGEVYVVTTALDGSGKGFEYKTQFFQGIQSGDPLPLGDGGMLVSYMKNPRWFVDLHMLVMESDSDVRDLGKNLDKARKEARLDDALAFVAAMSTLDPTGITQVTKAVDIFLTALSYFLKENGDDHIATVHDFYLKHQAFGRGRHPDSGRKAFQNVDVAYEIELTELV